MEKKRQLAKSLFQAGGGVRHRSVWFFIYLYLVGEGAGF
jgi:hypothetical protein